MQESSTNHQDNRLESEQQSGVCAGKPCCRTYFVSGFDPRGAAHYLALFQKELKARGYCTGKRITNGLITRWPIIPESKSSHNRPGEGSFPTELSFLHWDDIARANWPKQPLEILRQSMLYASFYFFKGVFIRLAKLCPGVALCGAYPLLFLLFAFSCAGAAAIVSIQILSLI